MLLPASSAAQGESEMEARTSEKGTSARGEWVEGEAESKPMCYRPGAPEGEGKRLLSSSLH